MEKAAMEPLAGAGGQVATAMASMCLPGLARSSLTVLVRRLHIDYLRRTTCGCRGPVVPTIIAV